MGLPPDENLPEVVPDQSPEVLSPYEAHLHQNQLGERYPKYAVTYDNAPKFVADPVSAFEPSPLDTVAAPPFSPEGGVPWSADASYHDPSIGGEKAPSERTEKRKTILGLRPGVFWALLVFLAVVLIAGISGGIAGGIAASKAHTENAVSQQPGSSTVTVEGAPNATTRTLSSPDQTSPGGSGSSPIETSPSDNSSPSQSSHHRASEGSPTQGSHSAAASSPANQGSPTTKSPTAADSPASSKPTAAAPPSPTPTFLNNQTFSSHGFAFQGFSDPNYQGKVTKVIQDDGFLNLPFDCSSYVWLPGDTDCCITFCNSNTDPGGWWCDERHRTQASGSFPRIWIGCGKDAHKQHACS